VTRPKTLLPVFAIAEDDGWCDAPDDPRYNRPVKLPYPASHERMWRADHLYDIVVVLGFNDSPIVPGSGSAIFLHVAAPNYSSTEGCVALKLDDVQALVAALTPGALIEIRS
jgi:L,D-peptidoglycan transpeptidase YkuD (ErfK/YbiS/YcfS/YnhG family)